MLRDAFIIFRGSVQKTYTNAKERTRPSTQVRGHNQRHKIRSVLQEHGYEFEALIEDLRSNLYHT